MRLALLALTVSVVAACSPVAPQAATTPRPVISTPVPATSTPRAPTPTPTPNYRVMRTPLLNPLGAMIIALRGGDKAQAAAWLAEFNKAADEILPLLERDMSRNANLLHSAIVNVRSHASSVPDLERDRLTLLDIT